MFRKWQLFSRHYLKSINSNTFNVNFLKLAENLNKKITLCPTLMKTYLFAYKPCDALMKIERYSNYYNWLSGLKNKPYFEVIEGRQEIRATNNDVAVDINDKSTYTTKEKGTDINLAVNMLSKAYQNAYDVAILISGDTDYIPVIKELHNIGKIVILATFPNQNVKKYDEYRDAHIKIDLGLLKTSASRNSNHV